MPHAALRGERLVAHAKTITTAIRAKVRQLVYADVLCVPSLIDSSIMSLIKFVDKQMLYTILLIILVIESANGCDS